MTDNSKETLMTSLTEDLMAAAEGPATESPRCATCKAMLIMEPADAETLQAMITGGAIPAARAARVLRSHGYHGCSEGSVQSHCRAGHALPDRKTS